MPGTITRTVTLPAQVLPDQQATLYAKVSGYLQSIAVDKGDTVKAGAVLARIEVPELQSASARQRAEMKAAEAEYNRLQESLQRAPDLVVPLTVDQARGRMEIARASLEQSETMLRYATITAPFSGVVTQRFVDPGALIQTGASIGAPMLTIMDFSTVRLQIAVPELEAGRIAVGQPVEVSTEGLPGRKFAGHVTRFSYALDPSTRTMTAEVRMANPQLQLRPGMLVTARIGIEKKEHANLLPRDAVVMEKTNAFVFVLKDGKAQKRPVKIGFREEAGVELLAGVTPDDQVIVNSGRALSDGQPVQLVSP
jgi:membrane fusion protein (multidrug efflux system)